MPRVEADPFAAAVPAVARHFALDPTGARPLRRHDAGNFLLPRADVVVRLSSANDVNRARAGVGVRVTGWLYRRGFPTVEPIHDEAYEVGGVVATVWRYLPQPPDRPSPVERATALGGLLRELHEQPEPPFSLPTLDPFARLRAAIETDDRRTRPVLPPIDRAYLVGRITRLADDYAALDFPCGVGLIHNDAHIGNVLVGGAGFVLADWDSARIGPREVDLVPDGAPGNRFGKPAEVRAAFAAAYRYDIAEWAGWPVLRDVRDLHSLASYIRTAPDKPASVRELRRRLDSLRTGRRDIVWRAVD